MLEMIPTREPVDTTRIVKSLELLKVVVEEKVDLNKNNFGLCPFHDEKTPSFNIFLASSGRARYHCFGCGAKGDIFNYLRAVDKLGYREAIYKLANLLNREIQPTVNQPQLTPSEPSEITSLSSEIGGAFCERDCQKYANLREDYEILLEENMNLRERLGLPRFQPSNETPYKTEEPSC